MHKGGSEVKGTKTKRQRRKKGRKKRKKQAKKLFLLFLLSVFVPVCYLLDATYERHEKGDKTKKAQKTQIYPPGSVGKHLSNCTPTCSQSIDHGPDKTVQRQTLHTSALSIRLFVLLLLVEHGSWNSDNAK